MDFRQALIATYVQAPCRVLPNALWKTLAHLAAGAFELDVEVAGPQVGRLVMRDAAGLYVYWTRERRCRPPAAWLDTAALALLHADYAAATVRDGFPQAQVYFRLGHDLTEVADARAAPAGFDVAPVRPEREAAAVADVISQCYATLHPAAETVASWTQHATFSPDLWLWIVDTARDTPAAVGIAEFDATVGEGALEWIQVLPAYRGRGLGQMLVQALLAQLRGRAAFASVSGEVHPSGQPEGFYRRCGFTGDDVWWVLRR